MDFAFLPEWHLFLPRDAGHVVALSGSGGKTTLLRAIADVWTAEGLAVVATTTTRTEPLADFVADDGAAAVPATGRLFRHGGRRPDGKWNGLAPGTVDALGAAAPGVRVVVEVDGAAKRPFKYYHDGEPVWPARTSLAVVVMGIDGVGEPAGEVVHRLGRPDANDPVGVRPDEVWQWDHAWKLLTAPGGYLERVPAGVPTVLALCGLEQQPDSVGLFDFTARAMADPRLPLVLFCHRGDDGLSLRTACRVGDDAERDSDD